MPVALEWDKLSRIDPDALQEFEKPKVDEVFTMFVSTEDWRVKDKTPEKIIQVLRLCQALLKFKNREVDISHKFIEDMGEEHAKTENELHARVKRLEQERKESVADRRRIDRFTAAQALRQIQDAQSEDENSSTDRDKSASDSEDLFVKKKKI